MTSVDWQHGHVTSYSVRSLDIDSLSYDDAAFGA
jgi:hypothetical protein